MSSQSPDPTTAPVPANAPASFVAHARVIGAITFVSRVLGLAREMIVFKVIGPGPVLDAFKYAFVLPNLFRKLLGEGALSAAFIPLYGRAIKADAAEANAFAARAVALQLLILVGITVVGEALLYAVLRLAQRPETMLGLQLAMLMLPYVIFVCAAALLGGILQVHRRFVATTLTSVLLNALMIVAIALVTLRADLSTDAGRRAAVWGQATSVIVAGVAQVLLLVPSLRASGFRFQFSGPVWTPDVKRMLRMTVPVALGLGVLQLGVMLDKQISFMMSPQSDGRTTAQFLGTTFTLPMAAGAVSRLDLAQYLYQFPLGVFGIAIATAIFPQLSGDAHGAERGADLTPFRNALSRGITSSLFIGLPASAGMAVVALPAIRLLFENGARFTYADSLLTARSTAIYSSVIWAFSVQQILNRGYYALHDMRTPLYWGAINLAINLAVEVPLLWALGESAMAVGTVASFLVQTTVMTVLLGRRVGLPMGEVIAPATKMLLATLGMLAACSLVRWGPTWPATRPGHALQMFAIMSVGGVAYFGLCAALRLPVAHLIPARLRRLVAR